MADPFKQCGFIRTTMVHNGRVGLVFVGADGERVKIEISVDSAEVMAREIIWRRVGDEIVVDQSAVQSLSSSGMESVDGSSAEGQQQ